MGEEFRAFEVSPGTWSVKWFKPELQSKEDSEERFVECVNIKAADAEAAIDAAILQGSWA